jgi:hypothetical protein
LIDEEAKNKVLIGVQKYAKKLKAEPIFTESRPRWFQLAKIDYKKEGQKIPYVVAVMVGKDERETMQILDEMVELFRKHTSNQKDCFRIEDYTRHEL